MDLLDNLLLVFIGLAGGVAVGSGFVAFLTVLDIIPRLTVITRTKGSIHLYSYALVAGTLVATWADFREWEGSLSPVSTVPVALLSGCFVGLLAAALTEVINVLPILSKRLGMQSKIIYLLMAMVFGKVVGSLIQWIIF